MEKSLPVFLTCASLALITLAAQPATADVSQDFAAYTEHLRNDEPADSDSLKAAPPQQLLHEIRKYLGDPSETVRVISLGWALSIANSSRELATRQEAVELALTGVEQEPLYPLANNIASRMVSLPPSAFSQKAKDIINRMMSRDTVSSDIVRLAGLANVQTPVVKQRLQKMVVATAEVNKTKLDAKGQAVLPTRREQSDRNNGKAAVWALAAMGDAAAVQQLIIALDSAPDAVSRMNVMQELANTRQPQAIAALARYLFSEERLPNTVEELVPSAAGNMPGPKLAFNVILFLSDVVEDWPADTVRKGTEEALAKARQWVTQQGATKLKIKR